MPPTYLWFGGDRGRRVIRKPQVKKTAEEALKAAGLSGPPTDLYAIAAAYGIPVQRGSRPAAGTVAHWDPTGAIVVGQNDRWPFAHELGHVLMRHTSAACYAGEPSVSDVLLEDADSGVSFEREADAFAQAVLVPKEWLERALLRGAKPKHLPDRFGVSERVIWIALQDYGLDKKLS